MNESLDVNGESRAGVPIITVQYGPEGMLQSKGAVLSRRMRDEYERLSKDSANRSLVVDIKADTAGSPLIRALVDLYKSVTARKGQLICAGYPRDFIPALRALGVTGLPGFHLVSGGADAALSSVRT